MGSDWAAFADIRAAWRASTIAGSLQRDRPCPEQWRRWADCPRWSTDQKTLYRTALYAGRSAAPDIQARWRAAKTPPTRLFMRTCIKAAGPAAEKGEPWPMASAAPRARAATPSWDLAQRSAMRKREVALRLLRGEPLIAAPGRGHFPARETSMSKASPERCIERHAIAVPPNSP